MKSMTRILHCLAAMAIAMSFCLPALGAADEVELKDASGNTIVSYIVEAPANVAPAGTTDPARQVGVIFCFQEHTSEPGEDILPVRQSLKRLGLIDDYVLLAIRAQSPGGGLSPADYEPVKKLLEWAKETYPVNPRRVYMYGKGSGGKVAGEFPTLNPNLITAGISYSWGWWSMLSEIDKPIDMAASAPELYLVLGLRDFTHHITTVRDTYERVKNKGYHVIYREFEELGPRSYHPTSNDDALGWATKLRNKNIAPSPQEMDLLKAFNSAKPPAPVSGYYPSLALVGGAPAGTVLRKLFGSSDAGVRAAAAETCNHAIFDEATTEALGKLLGDPSSPVREAAHRAIASYANWRYPAAQQVLIKRATDSSLDMQARVDAADGIAQAVKLQATGVQQDPPLFRALVELLDEKDLELRTVAFLALAPNRDYIIGGSGAGEFPPVDGWERWLDRITAEQAGDQHYYNDCASTGSRTGSNPFELFCAGGKLVSETPSEGFRLTLEAAKKGYVPAQEVVGMMYAIGKGVQQDYREAANWFLTAAEAGNTRAAINYVGAMRNGMYNVRNDAELSARWDKFLTTHPEYSRVPGR